METGAMRVAVVGAGMAGLACAEALGGHDGSPAVTLFDKGKRPGGRMSARTVATSCGEAGFDYGAQYMSARDDGFRARVARWRDAGHAAPWPAAGGDAFVGTPGMSAPIIEMASRLDVHWSTTVVELCRADGLWRLRGDGHGGPPPDAAGYDAVVVAVPSEQVGRLVAPFDAAMARLAAATPSQPCWTVTAAFAERLPAGPDMVRDGAVVGWAARNSAKPGRPPVEAWVIQAAPRWSAEHLEEDREAVTEALLAGFAAMVGIDLPPPLTVAAHRWRYARSGRTEVRHLWNPDLRLGLCGDWLIGPRVEAAWLSGTSLARAMAG